MLFGPIFAAEMVTTARRMRYYLLRLAYATFMFFMLWTSYESAFHYHSGQTVDLDDVARFARDFFGWFSLIQIIVILFLAPAMTAGTIALERERRTIEYLFATDLRNHEIVFGKLAARLVVIFCQVLAGLPILSLAMLMGGIEPRQLLMMFVLSASTLLSLAALGIGISVWCKRARDAVVRTYVILFALLFLPLVGWIPTSWEWVQAVCKPFLAANPLLALQRILLPFGGAMTWADLGWLVALQGALGVTCIILSVVAVRRVHLKSSGAPAGKRKAKAATQDAPVAAHVYRHRLITGGRSRIGQWPMLWKELFVERATRLGLLGTIVMLLIVAAVAGCTIWMILVVLESATSGFFWSTPVVYYLQYAMSMGTFLSCLALLLLAARASGAITHEKERDTWDSLLCSPLTASEVITAKAVGNLWSMRGVLALPVLVYLPALLFAFDFVFALPFILGTQLVLYLFVTMLGIMFSLNSRNTLRSMGGTLVVAVFLGGAYLMCCCLPMAAGGGVMEEFIFAPCMPFLLFVPGMGYLDWHRGGDYGVVDAEAAVAYFLGMVFYVIATAVLYGSAIGNFDYMSGRTSNPLAPRRRP